MSTTEQPTKSGGTESPKSDTTVDHDAERKQVHDVLKEFSTVLLGTAARANGLPCINARPMAIARLDEDCTLSFLPSMTTEKVDESVHTPLAHVFGQSSMRYFALRGSIEISRDKERIRALWSKAYDVYFDGPEDPRVVVVTVRPHEVELWDTSGAKGLRYLFQAARSLITRQKPPHDEKTHRVVTLVSPDESGPSRKGNGKHGKRKN